MHSEITKELFKHIVPYDAVVQGIRHKGATERIYYYIKGVRLLMLTQLLTGIKE